jgi:hypothetical protein
MDVGNENIPARDPDSYYHLPDGRGCFCHVPQTVVLQKRTGETMSVKSHLLLSLGGHSQDASDERHLPEDVSFFHTTPFRGRGRPFHRRQPEETSNPLHGILPVSAMKK